MLDAITETRADGVAMMREMITEAHRIIDAHWELLEELARELLQYRKLDEHEIKQIVGDLSPALPATAAQRQPVDRSPAVAELQRRTDGWLVAASNGRPIKSRAERRPIMIGDESLGYEIPMTW